MSSGTVTVIGAGLAGLSAAVSLAAQGVPVTVLEAGSQAGGRCRSYHDPVLDRVIDNGNHLVLSGNRSTTAYLDTIGAADRLIGPDTTRFAFADVASGVRWTVSPNDGFVPWWVLSPARRVPGTVLGEYLAIGRLLLARTDAAIGEVIACKGPLWERLLAPLLLAALNTKPQDGSAALAAAVLRETLVKGGRAYRPRIASPTLGAAFIEPALAFLASRQVPVRFGARLRALEFEDDRVAALLLSAADERIALAPADRIVLAVPAWTATELVPGVAAPTEFRAILNAHFAAPPPAGAPLMTGVIGGVAEWVFAFEDRISVTVSGADALIDRDRETLADLLWRDVARVLGMSGEKPAWQIVKERRATFAATPAQAARRGGAATRWRNLFLAGDWTDTGLPATIEGAVRSGQRAAARTLRTL